MSKGKKRSITRSKKHSYSRSRSSPSRRLVVIEQSPQSSRSRAGASVFALVASCILMFLGILGAGLSLHLISVPKQGDTFMGMNRMGTRIFKWTLFALSLALAIVSTIMFFKYISA